MITVFTRTMNGADRNGFGGYSWRELIQASEITGGVDKVKVTLRASETSDLDVAGLWIGHANGGDANYTSAPAQLLFGGSATATIPAGTELTSDLVNFTIVDPEALIVGCYCGATGGMKTAGSSANTHIYYNGPGDYASQQNPGAMFNDSVTNFVEKIEGTEAAPPEPDIAASAARTFAVAELAPGDERVSASRVFAVYNFPSRTEYVSAARTFVVAKKEVDMEVSGLRILAVVRGRVANPKLRVWTATLDSHDFFFLRLGDTATLVYDVATQKWSDWDSAENGAWRPNVGFEWIGAQKLADTYGSTIVAGDDTFGLLWFLDPEQPYDQNPDELRPVQQIAFDRVVTAQVLASGRQYLPCYAVFLNGDNYGIDVDDFMPSIKLETSDDQGRTFMDQGSLLIGEGMPTPYQWLSLGQIGSPGRIFKFTDNGVLSRVDSMDMNDDGEQQQP